MIQESRNRDGYRHMFREFATVFRRIQRREVFSTESLEQMQTDLYQPLAKAAITKCLDFNIIANRIGRRSDETFILVSNLRGICEDLITLTYISTLGAPQVQELLRWLFRLNIMEALSAQRAFFAANNPFQPVVGSSMSQEKAEQSTGEARRALREFWKEAGSQKRDGPTIRDMSAAVGLTSTYDYIYYVASNFVHFNPGNLLRSGWNRDDGPFVFSLRHRSPYYQALTSFYGCVLFIGYYSAFGSEYFKNDWEHEITHLTKLIGDIQRWPELVTFEELNLSPPLYFALHAARTVIEKSDKSIPYGAILQEVRSLRASVI
jgi:hypothetical protein